MHVSACVRLHGPQTNTFVETETEALKNIETCGYIHKLHERACNVKLKIKIVPSCLIVFYKVRIM